MRLAQEGKIVFTRKTFSVDFVNGLLSRFACLLPIFRLHVQPEDRESLFCLAVFRFAVTGRPDVLRRNPQLFGNQPFPLGQWRLRAFASVEDASPDLRETADSDAPAFSAPR
jgi:hypothetical protein